MELRSFVSCEFFTIFLDLRESGYDLLTLPHHQWTIELYWLNIRELMTLALIVTVEGKRGYRDLGRHI